MPDASLALGATLSPLWVAPFVALLLCIALMPLRAPHFRIDLRRTAFAERRRLGMLEEPVDEVLVVDRADVTVGQHDREPLVGPKYTFAARLLVEGLECLA